MANQISKETLFDKRLIERHLKKGLITRDQVREHLEQLPDASGQADPLDLVVEDGNSHDPGPASAQGGVA